MNRQVDVKALVSHIVRGDGLDKCRICMGDTTEGQVYLGDTVMMDGERPVTLSELLEIITGIEVPLEEDLPAGLCTECAQSAMDAASFRTLCRQAASQWDSTLQLLTNHLPTKYKDKTMYIIMKDDDISIVNNLKGKPDKHATEKNTQIIEQKEVHVRDVKHKCQCPDCGKKFAYAQHLYLHLKESMDFKRACYVCAKIMTRDELILHLLTAHHLGTYDCKKCPALFKSRKFLIRHTEEAHSPGACTCGDCGRSFKSRPAFNAHLSVHAVKTCPGCDRIFRNQTCYLHHVKKCCDLDISRKTHQTKHKVTIEVKNKKSERRTRVGLRGAADKECICDYCGKKLAGKKFITAHIQIIHLKNTHRPCPYCGKLLASAHMGEHLKKHEVETIFTCEHCGIVLKTKLGYVQHIRLHTGEKPYACKYCGETFSASSRRSEHIRKAHKMPNTVLKYVCEYCPARFQLPYKLRNHVSTVHNKEDKAAVPFSCKICMENFSSCRGLTHHSRKHQKEGTVDFKVYSHPKRHSKPRILK
ncbi:zinc finger protein 260-like isoform X1 [Cydia pomonella]|uniref:zinc finger protein 260-like isoform X1 n=1 Tax=Cydia pomonella TaxID=82600 RepID=UPI002ADE4D3A|nr:zinc finger protein 260-like isoform X1 [Cydia pomonella]